VALFQERLRLCRAPEIDRRWREGVTERSNREAVEFLIRSIDLRTLHTRDEGYYSEAANYVFALLDAHLEEPEIASELISRSNVLPFDGGNLIFSEAVTRSLHWPRKQEEALARYVPLMFLSTMPRAASAAWVSRSPSYLLSKNTDEHRSFSLKSSDVTGDSSRFRSLMQAIVETLKWSAPDWRPPDLSNLELVGANFALGPRTVGEISSRNRHRNTFGRKGRLAFGYARTGTLRLGSRVDGILN